MAPAAAASLAANHKRRPAPTAAAAAADNRCHHPTETTSNKKSRFYYKNNNKNNTLLTEPANNNHNLQLHSHIIAIVNDDYETVEEDYEFDDINDYEILDAHSHSSDNLLSSSPRCSGGLSTARDRFTGETVTIRRVRRPYTTTTTTTTSDDSSLLLSAAVREAACLAACRGHPSVLQLKTLAADETTAGGEDLFVVTEAPPAGATTLRAQLLRRRRRGFSEATTARDGGDGGDDAEEEEAPPAPMGEMRYRSPEQLYGGGGARYGRPEEDMWAIGCVMAELLITGGEPLFAAAETEAELLDEMIELRDGIVTMGVEAFDDVLVREVGREREREREVVSVAGRELLAGLLEFDDWERITAAEALRHRWFDEQDDVKAKCLSAS